MDQELAQRLLGIFFIIAFIAIEYPMQIHLYKTYPENARKYWKYFKKLNPLAFTGVILLGFFLQVWYPTSLQQIPYLLLVLIGSFLFYLLSRKINDKLYFRYVESVNPPP